MKLEDRQTLRRETRQVTCDLEVRDTSDGGLTFEGYATTYGQSYRVEDFLGEYDEEFAPDAFKVSLKKKPDVPLLVNHAGLPLARTSSGTLELTSTATGLRARSSLEPLDPDVASISYKMKRGDLNKMSIAFRAVTQEWSPDWDYRRITEAELYDVSIVTSPANPFTSAGLRMEDAADVDFEFLVAAVAAYRNVDSDEARNLLREPRYIKIAVSAQPTLDELFMRHYERRTVTV